MSIRRVFLGRGAAWVVVLVLANLIAGCGRRDQPKTAEDLIDQGSELIDSGQAQKAVEPLNAAIELNPRLAEAWLQRSRAYGMAGKLDEALADAEKAIELDPRSAAAYNSRAAALIVKQEYDAAIEAASKAIALDPKDFYGYWIRAKVFLESGRPEAAMDDIGVVVEQFPQNGNVLQLRAQAWFALGDHERAETDAAAAKRFAPELEKLPFQRKRSQFAWRPPGRNVAQRFDQAVDLRLVAPDRGVESVKLGAHLDFVSSIQFSPDGELLASAGHDGVIKLWDPKFLHEFDFQRAFVNRHDSNVPQRSKGSCHKMEFRAVRTCLP